MKRVLIVGCSGSGKSTLARKLGTKTRLAVHHLDALYWQPGWQEHPDPVQFEAELEALTQTDEWIVDGGFTSYAGAARFARADTVILFDLPTWLCLWRINKRLVTYWGRRRPDLADGCLERFDFEFQRYVATYRRNQLPKLEALAAAYFSGKLIRIKSDADLNRFLDGV